jgi:putative flippase GtrA
MEMNSRITQSAPVKGRNNVTALRNGFYVYLRAQFTALLATAADFSVTIVLKEIAGLWYLYAVGIGAATGAILAFLLGRNWVFRSVSRSVHSQALRYILVASVSWFLNTTGVWFLTEFPAIPYLYSKLFVSVIIGLTFNFILTKRFVFA